MIKLRYTKKMLKKGRKIIWQVVEKPANAVVGEYFFEEDAKKLADFHNKEKVWLPNGGIPKMLWNY